MKAIVCRTYGVLDYQDIEAPVPADNEVLIKVRAASVNAIDRIFKAPYVVRPMTGLRRPKNPRVGADLAGEVVSAGKTVTRFKPGDEVFGVGPGAFAEYACAREEKLELKPANAPFEQAAAVPVAGVTALQGLRDKGRIQAGQKVLINGAAGGVGTFAVQIAKALGAEVTAVCSTRNVEMVRSIGADHVIDYTRDDFTQGTERYDVLFDCISNHSFSALKRVLRPGGIHVVVGAKTMARLLKTFLLSRFRKDLIMYVASIKKEDLAFLKELIEAGKLTPVIERSYALSEAEEAFGHLETGHARGKLVITMERS